MKKRESKKLTQTIYERAEIGEKTLYALRKILKDQPIEILGHLDAVSLCCGGGTVAIVRVDLDEVKVKLPIKK